MSDYVIAKEIKPFLDEEGRLTALPGKNKKKLYALYYLAAKPDADTQWNEEQISILLDELTSFHNSANLRRELFNKRCSTEPTTASAIGGKRHCPNYRTSLKSISKSI